MDLPRSTAMKVRRRAMLSPRPERPASRCSESEHAAVLFEALVDFLPRCLLEAVQAKAFDAQAGQDAAVSHRAAETARRGAVVGSQVAEDAAREAVAGPGRVDDVRRRVGGHDEDAVVAEQ